MIEFRLYGSKTIFVLLPGAQPILFIDRQVDSNDPVALCGEAIGKPSVARTQVDDLQRTLQRILEPPQHIFHQNIEAASTNSPVIRVVTAQILEGERTVIIC